MPSSGRHASVFIYFLYIFLKLTYVILLTKLLSFQKSDNPHSFQKSDNPHSEVRSSALIQCILQSITCIMTTNTGVRRVGALGAHGAQSAQGAQGAQGAIAPPFSKRTLIFAKRTPPPPIFVKRPPPLTPRDIFILMQ